MPALTLSPRATNHSHPLNDAQYLSRGDFRLAPNAPTKSKSQRVIILERTLGDCEGAYYLSSRGEGLKDLCLHLDFCAPASLDIRARLSLAWSIVRIRHPLLASRVRMNSHEDIHFVYEVPPSATAAFRSAQGTLEFSDKAKDVLIDRYLNGTRVLSDDCLSRLILCTTPNQMPVAEVKQHSLIICNTHFIGDGVALHALANEILLIIGCKAAENELRVMLEDEWKARYQLAREGRGLPSSSESRLSRPPTSLFRRAAEMVDFRRNQNNLIGGQTFQCRTGPRRISFLTLTLDKEKTKQVLKRCKAHSVSISTVLYTICNYAWGRINEENLDLPTMFYSAFNIRPILNNCSISDSYWFLAVSYFHVILPSWVPASGEDRNKIFWHRSKQVKEQIIRATKSKMLISRTREKAKEGSTVARFEAINIDESSKAVGKECHREERPAHSPVSNVLAILSLLGNLDNIYQHVEYPDIRICSAAIGSRSGKLVVVGYTLAGKLSIGLRYDENGYDKLVVSRFWQGIISSVDEFLG